MDAQLVAALCRIEGVEQSPSMFSTDDALWCNGSEIAHSDGPGVIDLRLTKAVIKELRQSLRDDPRVTLRRGTSDWMQVHCTVRDLGFVVELVERAVAAHRRVPGEVSKPPPTGPDLERRRRLH